MMLATMRDTRLAAGVDEVGRGALFGPVVAAAVVLSPSVAGQLQQLGVTDSKALTPKRRQMLLRSIQTLATEYRVGCASVAEIDRINILQASLLAMKRAVLQLSSPIELCLVDGVHRIPSLAMAQKTIIKGDRNEMAIAAASIVAKVWRDELILRLAPLFPYYDLSANKGYGTKKHRQGIEKYGRSCLHRRSFKLR
ncbi:ribonuclease HII [Roseofilum casamattae]|uniref:Ribonuclease HII n=1 Tax=Roseofilum casamattae BLCC-M143 TaxID=3022442 RepID=A0ABT7C1B0_9CYAN|nr:ribonuclease HII [Roseofilum casamattae]MDJ1184476.1 ribonuclease HII [Roseofilum casamattae BLCC-M143]